jgi:hypothetical protein
MPLYSNPASRRKTGSYWFRPSKITGFFHDFLDADRNPVTERLPFRDQDHGIGAIERGVLFIHQFQLAAVKTMRGEIRLAAVMATGS